MAEFDSVIKSRSHYTPVAKAPISPGPASLVNAVTALADALATATSPQHIYDAALQGIRDAIGVERASVLLFDEDGVMRFKAWLGLSHAYRAAVEGHTPWTPLQPAPSPIVVPDVQKDATLAAFRDVFARENIRALSFVPLLSGGKTIGKFMLYWAEPRAATPEMLDAALTIGALVGLAVHRARAERRIARASAADGDGTSARGRDARAVDEARRRGPAAADLARWRLGGGRSVGARAANHHGRWICGLAARR